VDQQQWTAVVAAATRAPSIHNTQPWWFVPLDDGIAVHEDPSRSLASLDPHGRLRLISCGTAVTNAALAMSHLGYRPLVSLETTIDPTLVATVRRGPATEASADDVRRFDAIPLRRAHRRLHQSEPVATAAIEALCEAVVGDGARPVVPAVEERRRLGSLLRRAVRHQLDDPGHLAEVDRWIRHPGEPEHPRDGVPVASLGTTPYPADSLVHDGWDPEEIDELPLEDDLEASTVLAIATRGDSRHDWLVSGLALQRAWLQATALDLAVTFADQATQWPRVRDEAAAALAVPGELQVVLRIGHPLVDVPPTPRRELAELMHGPRRQSSGSER
jgi:hypothetical protein